MAPPQVTGLCPILGVSLAEADVKSKREGTCPPLKQGQWTPGGPKQAGHEKTGPGLSEQDLGTPPALVLTRTTHVEDLDATDGTFTQQPALSWIPLKPGSKPCFQPAPSDSDLWPTSVKLRGH